jgi:hypothetical protein
MVPISAVYVCNRTVFFTIDAFLLSAKALSFEYLERELVSSISSLLCNLHTCLLMY